MAEYAIAIPYMVSSHFARRNYKKTVTGLRSYIRPVNEVIDKTSGLDEMRAYCPYRPIGLYGLRNSQVANTPVLPVVSSCSFVFAIVDRLPY